MRWPPDCSLAGRRRVDDGHAEGAACYLTPTATASGILYEWLHRLLRAIGARPAAIEPETHDTILATASHIPHALANAFVSQAAHALAAGDEQLPATGPAFGTRPG